jgi:hypothetical protein
MCLDFLRRFFDQQQLSRVCKLSQEDDIRVQQLKKNDERFD